MLDLHACVAADQRDDALRQLDAMDGVRHATALPPSSGGTVHLIAGVAGVLAFESRAGAAVGVAISVTTIPAAAMAGVSAGLGEWSRTWGALVLLGVNVVSQGRRRLRNARRATLRRPKEAALDAPCWMAFGSRDDVR